jgi:hypothetical protein
MADFLTNHGNSELRARPVLATLRKRAVGLAAVGAIVSGIGFFSATASAEDGPAIRAVLQQFNRAQRSEALPQPTYQVMREPQARGLIPTIFRSPQPRQDVRALGFAPVPMQPTERYLPRSNDRLQRVTVPAGAFPEFGTSTTRADSASQEELRSRRSDPRVIRRDTSQSVWAGTGKGLPMGVNYCVRLCDGFAFPVGHAGQGTQDAQEAACQLACPGADVAMFSAPAGAKDIDEAIRNGRPYSSLPNAFKYRSSKFDSACTCKPAGATTSTAALLTDFTLRRGDLVMTRVGVRHFDGASRFPHRASDFPDALARLTDKKEIAMVRGMETASLRGVISVNAPESVRNRIAVDLERAERVAARQAPTPRRIVEVQRPKRGFEEIKRNVGPLPVRVVNRPAKIVALN